MRFWGSLVGGDVLIVELVLCLYFYWLIEEVSILRGFGWLVDYNNIYGSL